MFEKMGNFWRIFGAGSAIWSGRFEGNVVVSGEGVTKHYWGYLTSVEEGIVAATASVPV